MPIKFVIANPMVGCEGSFKRADGMFADQAEHDNFLTEKMLRAQSDGGLLCTGTMGDSQMTNHTIALFEPFEGIKWYLSKFPLHRSLLTGKTINLHGGPVAVLECEDCTDGNNLINNPDPRYVNVSAEFNGFDPVLVDAIYAELPEFLK